MALLLLKVHQDSYVPEVRTAYEQLKAAYHPNKS
jgi:DnaJ-class molecular chaperone